MFGLITVVVIFALMVGVCFLVATSSHNKKSLPQENKAVSNVYFSCKYCGKELCCQQKFINSKFTCPQCGRAVRPNEEDKFQTPKICNALCTISFLTAILCIICLFAAFQSENLLVPGLSGFASFGFFGCLCYYTGTYLKDMAFYSWKRTRTSAKIEEKLTSIANYFEAYYNNTTEE